MPKLSAHAYKLQLKIKNVANPCSNDVVVTQNNTHHISNSQKSAKSHDRENYMVSALKYIFWLKCYKMSLN